MIDVDAVRSYLAGNAALWESLEAAPSAAEREACARTVRPLGKGEHNENFVFEVETTDAAGQAFVLRVNVLPQPFHDNQVAYEFAALQALAPSGCVPRALYLDDSPQALGKGVLVESFCEGDELDFDNLRPGDLRCAAQLMADIHAAPVPADCPLFRPVDPLRELLDECVARYDVYRGTALEDPRYSAWIERFFAATQAAMDAAPASADERHIINTETLPSHFLIPSSAAAEAAAATTDATSGRFCAQSGTFLDWERPIIGEVAQDLGFFVAPSTTFWDSDYLFPRERIQSFIEDYWRAVDGRFARGSFDARFEAYLRVSVLRSQTWFCKNAARYAAAGNGPTTQRTFDKWDTYVSDEFNEMLWRECFC